MEKSSKPIVSAIMGPNQNTKSIGLKIENNYFGRVIKNSDPFILKKYTMTYIYKNIYTIVLKSLARITIKFTFFQIYYFYSQ